MLALPLALIQDLIEDTQFIYHYCLTTKDLLCVSTDRIVVLNLLNLTKVLVYEGEFTITQPYIEQYDEMFGLNRFVLSVLNYTKESGNSIKFIDLTPIIILKDEELIPFYYLYWNLKHKDFNWHSLFTSLHPYKKKINGSNTFIGSLGNYILSLVQEPIDYLFIEEDVIIFQCFYNTWTIDMSSFNSSERLVLRVYCHNNFPISDIYNEVVTYEFKKP